MGWAPLGSTTVTDRRWAAALRDVGRRLLDLSRSGTATRSGTVTQPGTARPPAPDDRRAARPPSRAAAPRGGSTVRPTYAPSPDGRPDPGEVVWTWVPYEDDPAQGKDRPVLVLSTDGREVVALMLTSKDHDRDARDEERHGRRWLDVGPGGWDPRGRPSEVRLDRVLRLPVADVRREGAALDRRRYDEVVRAATRLHGW